MILELLGGLALSKYLLSGISIEFDSDVIYGKPIPVAKITPDMYETTEAVYPEQEQAGSESNEETKHE